MPVYGLFEKLEHHLANQNQMEGSIYNRSGHGKGKVLNYPKLALSAWPWIPGYTLQFQLFFLIFLTGLIVQGSRCLELSTKYQACGPSSPTFSVSLTLMESGMALLGAAVFASGYTWDLILAVTWPWHWSAYFTSLFLGFLISKHGDLVRIK